MLINWHNKFDPKNENIEMFRKEGWRIRNEIEKDLESVEGVAAG